MGFSLTILLVVATVAVSWMAFNNPRLLDRRLLWPPAIVYGVFYVGYSIWMDKHGGDNVNHSAHLWGAGYGVLFTVMMEPRVVPYFLSQLVSPSFG